VVSKPSIRFKVKADPGIQTKEYICNISSVESLGPTQELGLRGGFESTSRNDLAVYGLNTIIKFSYFFFDRPDDCKSEIC